MRTLSTPDQSLPALLGGTAVLAVGVSLLETPCTAGLPLLWTSLLADQGVPRAEAVALFAVYLLVFLIDELLLFGAAVITMRATRVQERHGRALKILAGSVLVTLAVTMIAAPQALTSPVGTMVVFALATLLAVSLWWASARSAGAREPSPPG
jgi:cytochrome c biogenesis protein CcdA